MNIDLHLHTTASDGMLSPAQMVELAAERGMKTIAITDHDSVAGLEEAAKAGESAGMTVIPGLELSVGGEEEIHLLSYGVDFQNPQLLSYLNALLEERRERGERMLENLRRLGFDLSREEVSNPEGNFLGRAAAARSLVKRGVYATTKEAFEKLLSPGKPGYVPRRKIGVEGGVKFLSALGAVTVLAHPGRMRMGWQGVRACLPQWQAAGLMGLEAWHSSHAPGDALLYDRWARERGFLVTGGSDCHGKLKEVDLGQGLESWTTAEEDAERLLAACASFQQKTNNH